MAIVIKTDNLTHQAVTDAQGNVIRMACAALPKKFWTATTGEKYDWIKVGRSYQWIPSADGRVQEDATCLKCSR